MRRQKKCWRGGALLAVVCGLAAFAGHARADDLDAQISTLTLDASGGYSIYKSGMVASNDTGTTVAYGLGAYAGKDHQLGFALKREASTFAFKLNGSQIAVAWQDISMHYRLGPYFLGGTISSSAWKVSRPPDADGDGKPDDGAVAEDFLNIATTGYGIDTGFFYAVNKRGNIYSDLTYSMAGTVVEKTVKTAAGSPLLDRSITLGPRMDVDVGGGVLLTKWLQIKVGFKMRTYQITVDADAFKEQLNTTYVGLSVGDNF